MFKILCVFSVTLLASCATKTVEARVVDDVASLEDNSSSEFDDASAINEIVRAYHEAKIFDGVVIVANLEHIIYEGAFGEANRVFNKPFETNTRVRLASVSKPFTAALMLLLQEDGLLSVDQTVSEILPDFPKDKGDKITLSQLLSHSSGLANYQYRPAYQDLQSSALLLSMGNMEITTADLIPTFSQLELEFEPGSEYQYSNSNYVLLQAVIEEVTGKPFAEVLAERITRPLGLNDTGTFDYRSVVPNLADGYVTEPGGFADPLQAQFIGVASPGGLYSSAQDMARWAQALFGGKVFHDKGTLSLMLEKRRTAYNEESFIGYGIFSSSIDVDGSKVVAIGHDGWGPPFTANLQYFPEKDLIVFAADNTSGLGGSTHGETVRIAEDIVRVLSGVDVTPPTVPLDLELSEAIERVGLEQALSSVRSEREESGAQLDDEAKINSLGYAYLSGSDIETAIAVFLLNTELFPESSNAYDSLAEAYLAAGDTAAALAAYESALALTPDSERLKTVIRDLELGQ